MGVSGSLDVASSLLGGGGGGGGGWCWGAEICGEKALVFVAMCG